MVNNRLGVDQLGIVEDGLHLGHAAPPLRRTCGYYSRLRDGANGTMLPEA
jgi:hypothetical protein